MRQTACVALLIALATGSPPARAQPAPPAATSSADSEHAAVRLGREALTAYEEGHWDDAYQRFDRAEQLAHSPVFLLYMARCRRNVGSLLQAEGLLTKTSNEALTDATREPWRRAVAEARAEHTALGTRIPRVVLRIRGVPDGQRPAARIDDRELDTSELGRPLKLDPGPHRVVVRAGQRELAREIALSEGQADSTLEFAFDPAPATPPDATPAGPAESVRANRTPQSYAGFALLGVGAAGLALGATAGLVAWDKTNSVKANCDGVHCSPDDLPLKQSADRWATWSTAGFIAGGVSASAGLLLVVLNPRPRPRVAQSLKLDFALAPRAAFLQGQF